MQGGRGNHGGGRWNREFAEEELKNLELRGKTQKERGGEQL